MRLSVIIHIVRFFLWGAMPSFCDPARYGPGAVTFCAWAISRWVACRCRNSWPRELAPPVGTYRSMTSQWCSWSCTGGRARSRRAIPNARLPGTASVNGELPATMTLNRPARSVAGLLPLSQVTATSSNRTCNSICRWRGSTTKARSAPASITCSDAAGILARYDGLRQQVVTSVTNAQGMKQWSKGNCRHNIRPRERYQQYHSRDAVPANLQREFRSVSTF